jgi:glutaredoxin
MYLILGTPTCGYCQKAKELLESKFMSYSYVDLTTKYADWRDVFSHIRPQDINGQRSIPLIFSGHGSNALDRLFSSDSQWKFIGGYTELVRRLS